MKSSNISLPLQEKKMALVSDEIKAKSEVYYGDADGQVKTKELLDEIEMPNGLLPLKDIEECGYHRESGFVWLKQKSSITHKFEQIGKLVTYATEVTAKVEKGKIKKLTGVKAKELLVWLTLTEITLDEPPTGKINFKSNTGLSRTFPVSAFVVKDGVNDAAGAETTEVKEVAETVEV